MITRMVRLSVLVAVTSFAGATGYVHAALECAHLVNAAQAAIEARDKGTPLSAVLAEVERTEMKAKFNAQELNILRQVIRISFTSEYSPREILESCEAGELGVPRKK